MFTLFFSLIAVILVWLGEIGLLRSSFVLWGLGGAFLLFAIIRQVAFNRAIFRLNLAYERHLQEYQARYGNTSVGQEFLKRAPRLLTKKYAAKLAWGFIFHHWRPAVKETILALGTKTEEEQAAEYLMKNAAKAIQDCRLNANSSILFTTIAYFVAFCFAVPTGNSSVQGSSRIVTPLPHAPNSVAEAQALAIKLYPALAEAGSPMNNAFVERYRFYQRYSPEYFKNVAWPVSLADEVARNVSVAHKATGEKTGAPLHSGNNF